jgi:4-hydroxybenzoate polyprenyltransferase
MNWKITSKAKNYLHLIRFDKPIGTMLLLWPILFTFAMMDVHNLNLYVVFILGAFLTRSLGCVANDIIDRNFDKKVKRTKNRPLAANKISLLEAFIVLVILAIACIFLLLKLNWHTVVLGFIAGILIFIYPFSKRFFSMPQLILGVIFNFGIFLAISEIINFTSGNIENYWAEFLNIITSKPFVFLYFSCVLWTLAYDSIYALEDRDDDKEIGLKSCAVLFGKNIKFFVKKFYVISFVLIFFSALNLENFNIFVFLIISGCALLYIFKSLKKVSVKIPARANWFFRANNYYGLIIFIAIIAGHKI